jgi:hypothetical protein
LYASAESTHGQEKSGRKQKSAALGVNAPEPKAKVTRISEKQVAKGGKK